MNELNRKIAEVSKQYQPYAKICKIRSVNAGNTCDVEPINHANYKEDIQDDSQMYYNVKYSPSPKNSPSEPSVGAFAVVIFFDDTDGYIIIVSSVGQLFVGEGGTATSVTGSKIDIGDIGGKGISDDAEGVYITPSGFFIVDNDGDSPKMYMTTDAFGLLNTEIVNLKSKCGSFIKIDGCDINIVVANNGKIDLSLTDSYTTTSIIRETQQDEQPPPFKLPKYDESLHREYRKIMYKFIEYSKKALFQSVFFGGNRSSFTDKMDEVVDNSNIPEDYKLQKHIDKSFLERKFEELKVKVNLVSEQSLDDNKNSISYINRVYGASYFMYIMEDLDNYVEIDKKRKNLYVTKNIIEPYKKLLKEYKKIKDNYNNRNLHKIFISFLQTVNEHLEYAPLFKEEILQIFFMYSSKGYSEEVKNALQKIADTKTISEVDIINTYVMYEEAKTREYNSKLSINSILTNLNTLTNRLTDSVKTLSEVVDNISSSGYIVDPQSGTTIPVSYSKIVDINTNLKFLSENLKDIKSEDTVNLEDLQVDIDKLFKK